MNRLILIGHLGKDPEVRHTQSGKELVSFTLATTTRWKDERGQKQERTEWHRCTAWGDRWHGVIPYMCKGSKICVEGEVRYREGEYEGKKRHYTDIHVDNIELVSSRRDDERRQERPLEGKREAQATQQQLELDDDLPF